MNISGYFLAFYGCMAFTAMLLLLLSMRIPGFTRALAYCCIMACICFSGIIACISLAMLEDNIKNSQKQKQVESLHKKPVKQQVIKKPIVITPSISLENNIVLPPPPSQSEMYDEDGNLLEDDLSHENQYPEY